MYDKQSGLIVLKAMDLMAGEPTGDVFTFTLGAFKYTRPVMCGTQVVFDAVGGHPIGAFTNATGTEVLDALREAMAAQMAGGSIKSKTAAQIESLRSIMSDEEAAEWKAQARS